MVRRLTQPSVKAALVLLGTVLLFFWDVLFGDKVLLPLDNLYLSPPWSDFASQVGVAAPHNHLIGDMLLENLLWKSLARDTVFSGALPLWNPYIFSGMPFMATGQPGVLYPLGALFYVLPVMKAYGWFTALHLFLAGMFTYAFTRVLGVKWLGSMVAALTYVFSGFMVVSLIWPMVVSTVTWLPLILALIELIIREFERGTGPTPSVQTGAGEALKPSAFDVPCLPRVILWSLLMSAAVGMQFLAGHLEFSFYMLFTSFFFAAGRLGMVLWRKRRLMPVIGAGVVLCGGIALGTGLAAVQLIPFAEIMPANFRAALVTYQDVIGWALPKKRLLSFLIPDFFGNPSQHSYFDFMSWSWQSASHVFKDEVVPVIRDWDPKNYVEGCSYVGILPLILAAVAVGFRRDRWALIFGAYAVWSLLLAFGAPLYRIFFYGVPGFDQLHTPFRWIFPYTISVAVLAGLGADWLAGLCSRPARRAYDLLAAAVLAAGLALMVVLGAGLLNAQRLLPVADRLVAGSEKLQEAFANGQSFFSFEFGNVLALAVFLVGGGLVLWLARCRGASRSAPTEIGGLPVWQVLAVVVLVADLFFFGYDFNSRTDPSTLELVPPSIEVLKKDNDVYRVVSFGYDDVLTPNTGMLFGIQDARGYDSVIPKQYAEYWKLMEDPHGLLYNRIHKLVDPKSLESKYLDLLNVKYVLTTNNISLPNYTEVYRGEINVYRNDDCLPRAFVVPKGKLVANGVEALAEMRGPGFDPSSVVVLERTSQDEAPTPVIADSAATSTAPTVRITSYQANEVHVAVRSPIAGYLVLADSYFPGWEATINGQPTQLYKADHNFRAVAIAPGESEVVFRYDPFSFKLGGFFSLISGLVVILGFIYLVGRRLTPRLEGAGTIGRVAKNSLTPMATSFLNKGIDIAFAMLYLRILGPTDAGKFAFAITVYVYFEILTNFGLNTLVMREVAKDKSRANRYLSNTAIMRLLLVLASAPAILGVVLVYRSFFALSWDTALAIALLGVALVPGNISAALSSLFYAYEKMEYPAIIAVVSTVLKVIIGTGLLLAGYGFVGLAGTSVVVNVITAAIFAYLVYTRLLRPRLEFDASLSRDILGTSFPLMLNHFLATVFFRVDVLLLQPMRGDATLGYYTTAYKFIDGLNIIPSTFTFAIFPVLSRYAESAHEALLKAYTMSLRFLIIVSLPIAVGTAVLAEPIILLFGGEQYLPHSVIALQVLIWFLPFSYINSVTQYVLIAVNQQRFITYGFVVAATFNIVANLIMISLYSYVGAAIVTILSEIVLLAPFLYCVRRHVGHISLPSLMLRPVVAAALMGAVVWQVRALNPFLVIAIGAVVYAVALLALRTFQEEDRQVFRRLLARG
ncbi:MAG: oligosaccharide flippase family protein [Chloroflexota bacterium]